MTTNNVLKVSATTDPNKLGGAIAKTLAEIDTVYVKAIGAESVNQAVKGIIVARTFLASSAKDIKIVPGFEVQPSDIKDEVTITVFKLSVLKE